LLLNTVVVKKASLDCEYPIIDSIYLVILFNQSITFDFNIGLSSKAYR